MELGNFKHKLENRWWNWWVKTKWNSTAWGLGKTSLWVFRLMWLPREASFSWRVNFGHVYPALCSAWLTILSPSLLFCIQISLIAIYQIRNSLLLSEWSLKKVRILLRRKNIYIYFLLDFVSHTEITMLRVNWNCSPIKFSKAYIKVKGEMHIEWQFFVYKATLCTAGTL